MGQRCDQHEVERVGIGARIIPLEQDLAHYTCVAYGSIEERKWTTVVQRCIDRREGAQ